MRYFDLTSIHPCAVFCGWNSIKVGLTQPVGDPPNVTYPPENEVIDLLINDVTNTDSLFKYYDGGNEELSVPVNITNVKMISLSISDKTPTACSNYGNNNCLYMKDNL